MLLTNLPGPKQRPKGIWIKPCRCEVKPLASYSKHTECTHLPAGGLALADTRFALFPKSKARNDLKEPSVSETSRRQIVCAYAAASIRSFVSGEASTAFSGALTAEWRRKRTMGQPFLACSIEMPPGGLL